MLLFIDFYSGDFNGGNSDSFLWELAMTTLAFLPVLAGLLIQKKIDKSRSNEKLRILLFNFNEHLKPLIRTSPTIVDTFSEYAKELLETPFEDHLIKKRIIIPDLYRISEMNQESVFNAFYLCYRDKEEAAKDYRSVTNQIHFLRQIFELLYQKYDSINDEIYKQKSKFRDGVAEIKNKAIETIFNIGRDTELAISINKLMNECYIAEKSNQEKISLQIYTDILLKPLEKLLSEHGHIEDARNLYFIISANLRLRDYTIHAVNELGNLLNDNANSIPSCSDEIKRVSKSLGEKLDHNSKKLFKKPIKKIILN